MEKSLISIEDIKEVRPAAKEIPADRIAPFITEAQFHDLQPIIGEAFYYDLLTNIDNVGAQYDVYRNLLNGVDSYVYSGKTYFFFGLRPCLVYFSLARFYQNQPINVERYGLVKKKNEQSEPLTQKEIDAVIGEVRAMAYTHRAKAICYIQRNIASYPLFSTATDKDGDVGTRTGVKFF
jgi:hypothetical protein